MGVRMLLARIKKDFMEHMAFQLECKIGISSHISGQRKSLDKGRGGSQKGLRSLYVMVQEEGHLENQIGTQ